MSHINPSHAKISERLENELMIISKYNIEEDEYMSQLIHQQNNVRFVLLGLSRAISTNITESVDILTFFINFINEIMS